MERAAIREALLAWYDQNRRDLPWRRTRDPYAILVSEFLTQQTRIQAALGYYRRFLERFPTVRDLAEAPLEEVLRLWAGLGYYRRARLLHQAAREIMERHDGRIPRSAAQLRALPGLGEYTTAAVGSIAFGLHLPAVDGNVIRVLARLECVAQDPRRGEGRRRIRSIAGGLLDMRRPGDFNQALMELGARVCLPRKPLCRGRPDCPLARWCTAFAAGTPERFPPPPARRRPTSRFRVALLIHRGSLCGPDARVWMMRIPPGEWNEGLLDLPGRQVEAVQEAERAVGELARQWKLPSAPCPFGSLEHAITHHRIHVRVYSVQVDGGWREHGDGGWVDPRDCETAGLCARAGKALRLAGFETHASRLAPPPR